MMPTIDLDKLTSGTPERLYHGTTWKRAMKIRREGLLPGTMERANTPDFARDSAGIVSLADKEHPARFFGVTAAMHEQHGPGKFPDVAILVIDTKKSGVKFLRAAKSLARSYGGTEYRTPFTIPASAIIAVKRIGTKGDEDVPIGQFRRMQE